MANATVGLDEPAAIDKLLDCESLSNGTDTVYRERLQVSGASISQIAGVINSAPTTEYGLVTRNIPSGTQPISDASGSLTVDAPVGTPVFVRISNGSTAIDTLPVSSATLATAANQTTIIGHVDGIEGILTTMDVDTGNIATSVASIDSKTPALGQALAAASSPVVLTAAQITTLTPPAAITGFALESTLSTLNGKVTACNTGAVVVTTLPALVASSANIGDVDVLTLPALPSGSNNIGDVDVLTLPGIVGTIADDATTPGAPVMTGGFMKLFDGTDPGAVGTEDDVIRFAGDSNRRQYVNTTHPNFWSYHLDTSTAQTDTSVKTAPGSNLALFITDIVFSSGAATAINLFFEEGSTKILGPYYLEAVAGRGMHLSFRTPKMVTANTALTLTTSASIAHSVDITGFTARVS